MIFDITINAAVSSTANNGTDPYLRLDLTNSSGGVNPPCSGPANMSQSATDAKRVNSTSFGDFTFQYLSSLTTNYPSLELVAFPAANGGNRTIRIHKITITETAPPTNTPTFTLPQSTNIGCGSTTPITFTITNVYSTPGATYTWNLGATSNGWLYNGTPAPQNISTGTSSTLTLTPVCGATPQNVSATATVNGTNYSTNTSAIAITTPYMDISGNGNLCTGSEVYSISGLPCSATVAWSVTPSNIVNLTSSGNNATLTAIGTGEVTLTATITACGQTINKVAGIRVGGPAPVESLTIDGVDPATATLCHNTESMLTAHPAVIEQNTTYEWILPSDWTSLQTGTNTASTQDYMLSVYPGTDGGIYVRRLNECGYSDFYSVLVSFDSYCGNFYTISPNPATDNITIDGQKQKKNIKEVQVIDKTGQVRKVAKFGNDVQHVNLNLSGLAPDIYYIKIFDGKEWRSKPVRIN
jgi:hypothetical protein